MFDPSSFANPTPLAHADTSRDVLPRGDSRSEKLLSTVTGSLIKPVTVLPDSNLLSWNVSDCNNLPMPILKRNSRTTFLRSDWPRPFARREVGVEMELGRSENKRPEQRRS
ncbi:hypothetical protein TNCV_3620401 [Trichonephila clavipes]|nr:hypothetical protein TNCV_3620401 [Trichonephila clavipes]